MIEFMMIHPTWKLPGYFLYINYMKNRFNTWCITLMLFVVVEQATAQQFDFSNLVSSKWKMSATVQPNEKFPILAKDDVVIGVHTYLFNAPVLIEPEAMIFKGADVLYARKCGFYVELAKCAKPAREISIDLIHGQDQPPLQIAINGTNLFTPLIPGTTQVINNAIVTVPPAVAGESGWKGRLLIKAKKKTDKIRSVYIGTNDPASELYVDTIVVSQ